MVARRARSEIEASRWWSTASYTVQAPNDIVALDAATGRIFWSYAYRPSQLSRLCCGRVNRGLAILDDTLFIGTIDGHLIAVDADGRLVWDVISRRRRAIR